MTANRLLYPALDVDDFGGLKHTLALPLFRKDLGEAEWAQALESHCITPAMTAIAEGGDIEGFLNARQQALQIQLDAFLRQRCEWEFEDTPPLDSLRDRRRGRGSGS